MRRKLNSSARLLGIAVWENWASLTFSLSFLESWLESQTPSKTKSFLTSYTPNTKAKKTLMFQIQALE
jgi:hypothetical protein